MKAFAYVNAANEKEAIAALGTERGRILPLAGGMDLLALMKDHILEPDRVVNVKNLDRAIQRTADGGLSIGAAATLADLVAHAEAAKMYPALVQAAAAVGTPQIRNLGTVGGNLNQRPRCWYFRNEEFHCLKKGGSRCFAVDGENQFNAIIGGGPSFIVHPSSLAVPAIAFNATFRIAGPAGQREVPASEYYQLPSQNLYGETALAPNELLTHVLLPPPGGVRSASYEIRFRQSYDWPLAMAAVALSLDGRSVRGARVVMGAVAPVPWRSEEAEKALTGQTISEEAATAAAEAALARATPLSQNAYKIQIAKTAVKRAVLKAAGMLPDNL